MKYNKASSRFILALSTISMVLMLLLFPRIVHAEIKITASFYPLAFIAQSVAGSNAEVINMTPTGVEPHEFEPKLSTLKGVYSSRLFIYNGAGVDLWAEKLSVDLKKKGIETVNMTSHMTLLKVEGKSADPHFWLDPVLVKKEVEVIRDALIKIDPAGRATYEKNAADISSKLNTLNSKFVTGLKTCKHKDIIVTHSAFQYMAARYGLNVFSILGLSTLEEASPKKLAELSNIVKEKKMKYVFYESLVSPKLAETLANEAGVKTLTLNPCEGLTDDDVKADRDYLSLMENNLKNLKTALECN
ncbi:MAG: zinc ABC transporter substrate-binding protein [Nitrospirae bacterium]|nr:zinc ABC transporter substrate-binding protein [Nitrospirota bacterium]MBF0520921.1 zinc ABC transporter substrate-binding protein [Nitrospirota bacterium]MBF0534112.1 zinc ABC transporter substrate-binding protein [Nitrospirota bacterium]MBF0616999.1 zinc ABC transporter substrate-binding protein [Nitrospirota bacterium]